MKVDGLPTHYVFGAGASRDAGSVRRTTQPRPSRRSVATRTPGNECRARTVARIDALPAVETFPMLDEMERAMIMAACRKTNQKPVEAARLRHW